jgi:HK97 family phage prohead protease
MAEPVGLWIEGKAGAFGLDRDGEVIRPGAFDEGIAAYMKNPIVVYSHAATVIDGPVSGASGYVQLGISTDLRRDHEGLYWRAFIPRPASGFLLDVWEKIRAGYMRGLSVGGKFTRAVGSHLIDRVDLQEISIAPKPVNPEALITSVVEAFEAPNLTSCGESCSLRIGHAGKSAPGIVDLAVALELESFARGLRDVRSELIRRHRAGTAGDVDYVRREVAKLRAWTV